MSNPKQSAKAAKPIEVRPTRLDVLGKWSIPPKLHHFLLGINVTSMNHYDRLVGTISKELCAFDVDRPRPRQPDRDGLRVRYEDTIGWDGVDLLYDALRDCGLFLREEKVAQSIETSGLPTAMIPILRIVGLYEFTTPQLVYALASIVDGMDILGELVAASRCCEERADAIFGGLCTKFATEFGCRRRSVVYLCYCQTIRDCSAVYPFRQYDHYQQLGIVRHRYEHIVLQFVESAERRHSQAGTERSDCIYEMFLGDAINGGLFASYSEPEIRLLSYELGGGG
jgi:hypothetical protein